MPISNPLVDIPAIPERPLAFTCPSTIFVDRQRIIDDLYRLALLTTKRATQNMALIGPRRIGKSAIVERLFNHMWSGQREVIPLYFSLRNYAAKPALDTLTRMTQEFVNQYRSFTSGASDVSTQRLSLDAAFAHAQSDGDTGLEKALARYLNAIELGSEIDILEKLADLPHTIADANDCSILVFIDEFQVIMQMLDQSEKVTDLRATFKGAVESPRCTFFVTGSAVTIMREQIIGQGPLFGRFRRMHIPPLEQYWGLELVRKLATVYGIEVGADLASYIVSYTNAHPYYIHCFMVELNRAMMAIGETSASRDRLSNAISAEETEGELSNFFDQLLWGFVQQYKPIAWPVLGFVASHDQDDPIDHGMLYQFLDGLKDDMPWLAKYAELETATQMLKDLTEADIVQTNGFGSSMTGPYRFGSDPVLRRYIQLMYEHEVNGQPLRRVAMDEYERLAGLTRDYKRQLGYLLESHVKYLMIRWDNRSFDGALFGTTEDVLAPAFNDVYDTVVKAAGDRMYQIDAFGYHSSDTVGGLVGWAVECRFRNRKTARKDIETFAAAVEALKNEHQLAAVRGWFVSIEGFTTDALETLDEYGIYSSGKEELNALLTAYGLRTIEI